MPNLLNQIQAVLPPNFRKYSPLYASFESAACVFSGLMKYILPHFPTIIALGIPIAVITLVSAHIAWDFYRNRSTNPFWENFLANHPLPLPEPKYDIARTA